MSLYDRLVPAEALRFDRTHPMTRPWLELDAWMRANPAIGHRIDGLALWESLPPHVHFMRTGEYATGGFIPKGQPIVVGPDDGPLYTANSEAWRAAFDEGAAAPPEAFQARSWLPWRKRR